MVLNIVHGREEVRPKKTQMGVICGKRQAKFCTAGGPFEVFPGVLHFWHSSHSSHLKETNFFLVKYESLWWSWSLRSGPLSFGTFCLKLSHWILWNIFLNLISTDIHGMFLLFLTHKMHIDKNVCFFGAHLPLCRENSRFQTHIHSLQSLTRSPIFNQTGFIQSTPPTFYSSHYGEISLLQHICNNRSHVRCRTHTCTPFVRFNASHLFHFCHTHTRCDTPPWRESSSRFVCFYVSYLCSVRNAYFHSRSKVEGVRYV